MEGVCHYTTLVLSLQEVSLVINRLLDSHSLFTFFLFFDKDQRVHVDFSVALHSNLTCNFSASQ